MDMKLVEDWLSGIPSKYTRKSYKSGIKKFENEYYNKPIETLIKSPDAGKVVELFGEGARFRPLDASEPRA